MAEQEEYKVDDIPLEICREVLSYLPVKSVLRFRSVSKQWKSIIHDPLFAFLHLRRYPNNRRQSDVILLEYYHKARKLERFVCCFNRCIVANKQTTSKLHIPIPPVDANCVYPAIHGYMDGMFLMQWAALPCKRRIDEIDVFLWNPSVKKIIQVPVVADPNIFLNLSLGFDPSSSDYKVVRLNSAVESEKLYIHTEVFSVNTRTWRKGATLPGIGTLIRSRSDNKLSLGDSVYWVGTHFLPYGEDDSYQFVMLNMTYETLSYTALPDVSPFNLSECKLNPVAVSGSLVGLLISNICKTDIWVLERSPGDGSCCCWSRKCTLDRDSFFRAPRPHAYSTRTRKISVVPEPDEWWPFHIGSSTESLMLLS